jgi:glucosamine-6-phosphate deaminase
VNDGAFATLNQVPHTALSLTMPALMAARWLYCMVPGPTKAEAVHRTLTDVISTDCPATILRRHPAATLYLDRDSARNL